MLIVGGGAAAWAAAIKLRELKATVVVATGKPRQGRRLTEVLASDAREALLDLDVWGKFLSINAPRVPGRLSCWGSDDLDTVDHIFDPRGEGWILDRLSFDSLLTTEASRRGVGICREGVVRSVRRTVDGWQAILSGREGDQSIWCGTVIVATGRSLFSVPGLRCRRMHHDSLVAIGVRAHRATCWSDQDHRPLIEAVEDGWWYSILATDGYPDVAFLTDADRVRELVHLYGSRLAVLQAMLGKTRHTIARLGGRISGAADLQMYAANCYRVAPVVAGGAILAGDAAMAIDPLSGQGTYLALIGAIEAAKAVVAYPKDGGTMLDDYAHVVRQRFMALMMDRVAIYGSETRWRGGRFWRRRRNAAAHPGVAS